jgi:putative nucleotidyltransferase with HDIG domain
VADRAAIRARVEGLTKVVTIPAAVGRITAKINSGTATAAEIAADISQDQVLAAKVLKLVNSGFYGFRQPITTITHALVMLGLDVVKNLVLTASVMDLVDAMNTMMSGLWLHSLGTARAASAIAERLDAPNPEEHALSGLLHDVGKVVIAQVFPAEYARITAAVAARHCLQLDAEQEVLGVTHAEVGFWLLKKWALPDKLVYPIAYHHAFHARRDHADRTAIVHVADILCRALAVGYPGDGRIPAPHPDALAMLDLPMSEYDAICRQLDADASSGSFA